jgi:predicted nucleic acid-binding protein
MKGIVVDGSVAVKWLVPEQHAVAALRLLNENSGLGAPDIILAEVGNVLWKKWRRGEIEPDAVPEMMMDFRKIPLHLFDTDYLFMDAWDIAKNYSRSFYDSLYVALAVRNNCRMVTADLKLYNALKATSLKKHILWIEDIP